MQRRDKVNYYLDLAEVVAQRGTCLRRLYGAVIVKNDEVISTGYVGAPRGRENCCDLGYCTREKLQIPRGERYELCRSVHAEANAIISAGCPAPLQSSARSTVPFLSRAWALLAFRPSIAIYMILGMSRYSARLEQSISAGNWMPRETLRSTIM